MGPLVLRADAGPDMGSGHVMRSLALADEWSEAMAAPATFLMAEGPDAVMARIRGHGHRIETIEANPGTPEDLEETFALLTDRKSVPVVVDGYHFDPAYLQRLRSASSTLVYLDDVLHHNRYPVDVLVNPSVTVTPEDVPDPAPSTTYLLGPDHVLLRPEFAPYRDWARDHPEEARNLLVTLGGTDPDGVTADLLTNLAGQLPERVTLEVITRSANASLGPIERALDRMEADHRLVLDVSDMAERMAEADAAISAGGVTAWELAYMQVPTLVGRVAENQDNVVRSIAEAGAGVDIGWWSDGAEDVASDRLGTLTRDRGRRFRMGQAGRRLVDGRGTQRVVDELGG